MDIFIHQVLLVVVWGDIVGIPFRYLKIMTPEEIQEKNGD